MFRFAVTTCAAICATAVAAAQQPPAGAPPDRAAQERQAAEINARPDSPGSGRFAAIKEEVPSLSRHVVYRPKDLGGLGGYKLGVVAWGNGGCSDDGASSRFHLLEIASHGYLVIASGRILSGPGAPPREPRAAAQAGEIPPVRTQPSDLTEAVDWALAENQRRGSAYFGRIDPSLVAYSGWSCGGLQALQVAKDPRVKTLVIAQHGRLQRRAQHLGARGAEGRAADAAYARHLHPRRANRHCVCQRHGRLQPDCARASCGGQSAGRARRHLHSTEWRRGRVGRRELARLAVARRHEECEAFRRRRLRALSGRAVVVAAQAVRSRAVK